MHILLTAFKGNNNSSKVLLDLISSKRGIDQLYLENNFQRCITQINQQFDVKAYDIIFSFAQVEGNRQIIIETTAKVDSDTFDTDYAVDGLYEFLKERNYEIMLRKEAEAGLPNHLYAVTLNRIKKELLPTKMVLLRIPTIEKVDILKLAKDLSYYLNHLGPESK